MPPCSAARVCGAQCPVDSEEGVDLLADQLGCPGAQDESGAAQAVFRFREPVFDLPPLMVGRRQLAGRGQLGIQQAGDQPERLGAGQAGLWADGHGVLDDPHRVSSGRLLQGASGRAGLTVPDVLRGRSHDGQVGAVGQQRSSLTDSRILVDPLSYRELRCRVPAPADTSPEVTDHPTSPGGIPAQTPHHHVPDLHGLANSLALL